MVSQWGTELLQSSLELEVVNRALSWRSDAVSDVMPFEYWEVTPASPDPTKLTPPGVTANDWAAKKLYGEQWGHFGAFASRAGREWDWLWGRLDAAMSISAKLLEISGIPKGDWSSLQQRLAEAIFVEEGTTGLDVGRRAVQVMGLSGTSLALEWLGVIRSKVRAQTRKLDKLMDSNPR